MALTAVFFLYWGVEFILDYVESKKDYPDRFAFFSAEYVNKYDISLEEIEKKKKIYFKKFKRSIFKEVALHYGKFLTCFSIVIAIIVAMCL